MRLSHFFIDRPIFASVISLIIVIVGTIAYLTLPVAQFPEIVPPTISVTTSYPGANAVTVSDTVASVIEQEVNGVEGMIYMYSQSTDDGNMSLSVTFDIGTDIDKAQVLVQNRIAVAEPRLPEEVRRNGILVNKRSPDLLLVVHLVSPDKTYDQVYISNYALLNVKDELARIPGVGDVTLFGSREYSMRIWLDPERIALRGMTADEVMAALRAQNLQVAGGSLGQPPQPNMGAFQMSLQLKGRLLQPAEFENIVLKTGANGRVVRVKDVGRVELGALSYTTYGYQDSFAATVMPITQQPGSNAIDTANAIKAEMKRLSERFPKGLEYRIIYNPTEFIEASISELYLTIIEAVFLVVVVVLLFLQTWRATIIPLVAIPVSLIGTFAVMQGLGFSINMLTLFGLVLAVGIVVDDAIVVVENVERKLSEGLSAPEAAHVTMNEVGAALIAIALVLTAVFIPTAFIGGITGMFYKQFAVTVATATIISAFNSLTLQSGAVRHPAEAAHRAPARKPADAAGARRLPAVQQGVRHTRRRLRPRRPRRYRRLAGGAGGLRRAARLRRLAGDAYADRLHPEDGPRHRHRIAAAAAGRLAAADRRGRAPRQQDRARNARRRPHLDLHGALGLDRIQFEQPRADQRRHLRSARARQARD